MSHVIPLVSIIIPCFKVEPYLEECLDSILRQKEHAWEAIIIDDGSPDNSGAIADSYASKDKRFIVVHQRNRGAAVARNQGLEIASGRWIWFVDGDDYIVDEALTKLFSAIESYNCDTVFFGLLHRFDGYECEQSVKCFIGVDKASFLEQVFCYTNPSMLFSNDIIRRDAIRFTPGLKMAEDLEFQYKYLLCCNIPVSISDCLYVYRHREESATTNKESHKNNLASCFAVARNLLSLIENETGSEQKWLSFRIRTLIKSGLQAAEHLSLRERPGLQQELRAILNSYINRGYLEVKDRTLALAYFNLSLYFFCLRLYYIIKRVQ